METIDFFFKFLSRGPKLVPKIAFLGTLEYDQNNGGLSINPGLTLKWPFGTQGPGSLLSEVIRVSNRNFLRLLRGASLRLWQKKIEITGL